MKLIFHFVALLSFVGVFSLTTSAATIYKCKMPDGSTTISQFPCADDSKPEEVVVGSGPRGYGAPGLSWEEWDILDDADDQRAQNIRDQKKHKKEQDKLARQRQTLEFRCNHAKEHLSTVREERRKGYSARSAEYSRRRLDDAKDYEKYECGKLRDM